MSTITMNAESGSSCAKKKAKTFGDPVSRQDVEIIAKRALGPTVKVLNYHVRTYSKETVGFMGSHRHLVVTVQAEGSADKEIHTFFLKGIPYDIEEQASAVQESKAFYKEANFYKYIVPQLTGAAGDKSWVAQCYLINDSVMVFEDLKSKNFTIKDKLLDVVALKSALIALAKMHAASIFAEKQLGTSFAKLHPSVFHECLFVREGKFHSWFCKGTDVVVAVAKSLGLDESCVPAVCSRILDKVTASPTRRNVVCHGDPWSYNMMFDDSRPLPRCVLVDFQILRYVPPMTDVAQLLYLTTRREFRERNEEDLLRFYHEALCAKLRENDAGLDLPRFQEILEEYEEMRVVGVVTAALYYPVMLVEGNLCAELTKDSDGFAKLIFKDRVDLVFNIMEKDPMYKTRIVELVTELVQRSKQFLSQ